MAVPAERYVPSTRPHRGLEPLDYPWHDWTATVTTCGRICYPTRKGQPEHRVCRPEGGGTAGQRLPESVRRPSVTHVVGMIRHRCTRNGPWHCWRRERDSCQVAPACRCATPEDLSLQTPPCERRWRRERDSNPRYGFPYSGFQDHRHQPLGHPSARYSLRITEQITYGHASDSRIVPEIVPVAGWNQATSRRGQSLAGRNGKAAVFSVHNHPAKSLIAKHLRRCLGGALVGAGAGFGEDAAPSAAVGWQRFWKPLRSPMAARATWLELPAPSCSSHRADRWRQLAVRKPTN